VVSKPATATALVSWRVAQLFAESGGLPEGALSLVCGSAGDMLSHLRGQDVLSFTGSSDTAALLRALDGVVRDSVHVNVEADSLNAAVLAPDVEAGSDTEDLFVADVARDITQKTGQKCTAIRRVFAPSDRADAVIERIVERLRDVVVGNPAEQGVRMGPLATAQQLKDVRAGIERLAAQTKDAFTGTAPEGVGYFVPVHLRRTDDAAAATAMNEHEVFGPVATVASYDGTPETAAALVRLGEGGLVASVYSDDRAFLQAFVPAIASHHGRVFIGSKKVAGHSPGPGTVLPLLTHGGPGRAGGGEELGGLRGLTAYQQRTAIEGDKSLIASLY
jgi:oxepin-CoA hydrolase/3-oxo-5,6-dehydrosuberyl-CoA semialdehyde dehydrogenase